jgi:hypothetical protein
MREQTAVHVPTKFVRLPDGRGLAYAEYGDPKGHPTLYFHGLPGSRLEAVLAAKSAAEAGIRLIAGVRFVPQALRLWGFRTHRGWGLRRAIPCEGD